MEGGRAGGEPSWAHMAPAPASPEVWVLLQPAGCRTERFGQRPICLLNQPPPASLQWGLWSLLLPLEAGLPSPKPPPSPCASALPAQGFLLCAARP